MDGQRFDELTRRLARGASRRRVLQGAGAVLASGAATLLGRAGADARRVTQAHCGNVVCGDDPSICKDECVCCAFGNGNSRCMPPRDCDRRGGASVCESTSDCPLVGDCIDGICLTCEDQGLRTCGEVCAECCDIGDCASGQMCISGTCQTPRTCSVGASCQSQCQDSTNPNCTCGTNMQGESICYEGVIGCPATYTGCQNDTDCSTFGADSICYLEYCSLPEHLCDTDSDCGNGYYCSNLNGGCGGCDQFTGGQGVCNPVCIA